VAKGRRDKENATGDFEILRNLAAGNHALQVGERGGEEGGLTRHDQ
jgi:hypothetical protein